MEERREHDQEHEHEGTFAEGQKGVERHPEQDRHGEFGRGEEVVREEGLEGDEHEGTFAAGQEAVEHHPEVEHEGKFAEGQELPDRIAEEERGRLEEDDRLP